MRKTILATDLDGTFLGGSEPQRMALYDWLLARRDEIVLIYASGRSLTTMQDVLSELPIQPDHVIANVGTSFYSGPQRAPVGEIEAWLNQAWPSDAAARIHEVLRKHPHMELQPIVEGRRISCFYSDESLALAARDAIVPLGFDVLFSAERYFDVLPRGVQKGPTLLKILKTLHLPPERTLVAGDTLNDLSLFQTGLAGVAVANREPLLTQALAGLEQVHLSDLEGAAGVLDALQRFH
ncbi:MAG: HAD-IIB family hydrolase [Polaromonas sp.]|nr:HAD-IIB family hydrolase [Polaromonas sp.]